MSTNVVDVSTLTVAGTSIGLSSASPTKTTVWALGARQAIIVVEGAPVYVRSDGDAATSADILLNAGDVLPILGNFMQQTLDNLRFIRKTSTSATLKIIWYSSEALVTERIIRGAIGLVTSSGEEMTKAEDAAHTSGDNGIMALTVRNDVATSLAGTDGDYAPLQVDQHGGLRIGRPVFGEPTLAAANNGSANWAQGIVSPLDQKSPTGWLACLYGGLQTGDDWARLNIPVDELLLTKFTDVTGITQWTYWMTNAETMGVNIVFWVHDPTDSSKRAEITQLANVTGLAKAAGWNKHILSSATQQFFWYGENVTGSGLTAGTQYTLAQFIADVVFSTYTIYRITIEFGWEASGTFEDAFVGDLMLNGIVIPLKPDSSGSGRIAQRLSDNAAAVAFTIAPKTPYKLLSMDVHASAVLDTGEALTITKDAGAGANFDTVIFSQDLFIGSVTSLHAVFGDGYEFPAEDELDVAQANGSSDSIGITVKYQTVFS